MLLPCGDFWRQLRRICNKELLSPKHVQAYTFFKQSGSVITLSELTYALTYEITTRSASRKKLKHQEALISIIDEAIGLAGGFTLAHLYPSSKLISFLSGFSPKLEKIHHRRDKILNDIIHEHKTREDGKVNMNHSLVDILLKVQEYGNLEVPFGLFGSSRVIEWAMSELLRKPYIMDKAQTAVRWVFSPKFTIDETEIQSFDFLNMVIKEIHIGLITNFRNKPFSFDNIQIFITYREDGYSCFDS
ncbi:putative premnaspirodiene oxygenase [Helianthus anomalus]